MLKLRLKLLSNTLLILSKGLQFIFRLRKMPLIRNLLSLLTIIQRDRSLRSCLWENQMVYINLELKELLLKLRRTTLRSELEVDICPLMSSWISILLSSLRNLKERIHSKDLVRRLQSKRQLLIQLWENHLQLEAHLLLQINLQEKLLFDQSTKFRKQIV